MVSSLCSCKDLTPFSESLSRLLRASGLSFEPGGFWETELAVGWVGARARGITTPRKSSRSFWRNGFTPRCILTGILLQGQTIRALRRCGFDDTVCCLRSTAKALHVGRANCRLAVDAEARGTLQSSVSGFRVVSCDGWSFEVQAAWMIGFRVRKGSVMLLLLNPDTLPVSELLERVSFLSKQL